MLPLCSPGVAAGSNEGSCSSASLELWLRQVASLTAILPRSPLQLHQQAGAAMEPTLPTAICVVFATVRGCRMQLQVCAAELSQLNCKACRRSAGKAVLADHPTAAAQQCCVSQGERLGVLRVVYLCARWRQVAGQPPMISTTLQHSCVGGMSSRWWPACLSWLQHARHSSVCVRFRVEDGLARACTPSRVEF